MDGTRDISLRFPREQAQVAEDDLVLDPSLFAVSLFALAAFAVWFVTLHAIARSGNATLTVKTLWSLAVLALPVLGGLLWLRFASSANTSAEPSGARAQNPSCSGVD
ncbi:hypothetical protein Srot_0781 [Segniliparus rotundus DSM 44985]|uniref:Cardiolipin synthase N-terminal domain-containing protein n=1 Tax=Segniliparus rotundus (strain ATCC BAA-972 / CDC 1076 / CIP 108378 / DSM 44985 / JCM 13578) TaxID=640132 RepID=D6ZDJ6_SEGRD|nr:PLDc N-terminal domain-containing protein [Segniliparus rotundus]ADG97260.1 hypothetical protein Srot_0781 [Segniliparus rotundus DSM 44985]